MFVAVQFVFECTIDTMLTEQEVFEKCIRMIDVSKFKTGNLTLCVDGTSCTKKTSILDATGCLVTKVSRLHKFTNANTYFPATIGYISEGLLSLRREDAHFNDRSPLNVLDWNVLWSVMTDFLKKFGNVRPSETHPEHKQCLDKYRRIFQLYRSSSFYMRLAKEVNCIAFVDSDIERCDELRMLRKESSDTDRVTWKFYTYLQNLMYTTLYPDLYIDMHDFGNCHPSIVVRGVSKFLFATLAKISRTNTLVSNPSLAITCKLPLRKLDYNLVNMEAHMYRSIGRWGSRKIMGDERNQLSTYAPSYLSVDNIVDPKGTTNDERIVSMDIEYLFKINPELKYEFDDDDDACCDEAESIDDFEDELFADALFLK